MRKFVLFAVIIALLASSGIVYAAPPPDGPPGLERAIAVKERHVEALLGSPGVAGVGVGLDGQGRPAVIVFTETPGGRGLPASLEGVPVVVAVSGKFTALPAAPVASPDIFTTQTITTEKLRPAPIGVSTGHPDITAGTIGARVRGADGKVYALSNNHVYANQNKAKIGDPVLQPGSYDGGKVPDDTIGNLSAFKPIVFRGNANNVIDAAIALSSTDNLSKATPSDGYGTPKSATAKAAVGMDVQKYGRTTGLTTGKVYATNATVKVQYSNGVARFISQIIITPGTFSAGGYSGSLIVVKDGDNDCKPVGLLFAGSSSYTIANPINAVLSYFKVTIDGSP